MKLSAPKGTKDILPNEIPTWEKFENVAKEVCEQYGFKQIRTPEFEFTDLFVRGVGEGTDIVTKEMYTFSRNDKDSFTLKPEGTAPVMRAYIQNGMSSEPQPVKLFYITSCYRAENPQKGRMRQFHQLGCEILGSHSAYSDALVISLADTFIRKMGVNDFVLHINSVGCPKCRKEYYDKLREYLKEREEHLCEDCKSRIGKNPMRVLDCKNEKCRAHIEDAPLMKDYLCDDCSEHFELLQKALKASGVEYEIDYKIVRGLDYYTNTAFEFISDNLGAQSTICGGGRYNGLIKELGGDDTPGVGFGLGVERLLMLIPEEAPNYETDLYIAGLGEEAVLKGLEIQTTLINEGFRVTSDVMGRSLKAQMKYADKVNAGFVLILGEDEIKSGVYTLRNMQTKEQYEVKTAEEIIAYLRG